MRNSAGNRGLGWRHRQQRAELLRQTPDGTPCQVCGDPMYPESDPGSVDADHSLPRALGGVHADRLLHRACNRGRGLNEVLITSEDW
jgi:5-methylcytosine-specific restriction endonuclease McrA